MTQVNSISLTQLNDSAGLFVEGFYTIVMCISQKKYYNKAMLSEIVLLILVLVLLPTAYAGIRGAPLALTAKKRLQPIIETANIKKGDVFYDLGSGTARVMVAVAKKTGCKVVGFELSPVFYLLSFLNLKIHKIKGFELKYRDFFYADLKKADVVFMFLMPKPLKKLVLKLEQELRPGAQVISYCFPIKKWKPEQVIKDENDLPIYFYAIRKNATSALI